MSYAIAHFAVGAALTFLLLSVLAPRAWYRWPLTTLGGAWAVLPDVVLDARFAAQLPRLHADPWVNLFWGHGYLDAVDPDDSYVLSGLLLAGFVGLAFVGEFVVHLWTTRSDSPREARRRGGDADAGTRRPSSDGRFHSLGVSESTTDGGAASAASSIGDNAAASAGYADDSGTSDESGEPGESDESAGADQVRETARSGDSKRDGSSGAERDESRGRRDS